MQNFGEDKLREELGRLQEDKNTYQSVAKESLKKVLQEKLEAVRKLQELERWVQRSAPPLCYSVVYAYPCSFCVPNRILSSPSKTFTFSDV